MNELSKANILFSTVTSTLERIQNTAGHPKKVAILSGYFEKFAKFRETFVKSNVDSNSSIYPVLRLIIPKKDVDRDRYGIQTYTFGQIYVRILGVQPKSDVAKRLTAKCSSKDYPNVVYDIMKNRCCDVCKLTVYDVNKHLDTIAECYNNNNRKSKFHVQIMATLSCASNKPESSENLTAKFVLEIDDEIIKMVQGMTAIDQKWLVRIILKDMNLGVKPGTILTTFAPSEKEFLNQYSSLSRVCQAVENGEVYEESASVVELFRRCNPMLCQRGTVEKLQSLLSHKEYYLETKMDGERFHMHMKDGEYKYFSRGGHEFNTFGSNKTSGSLTPFVEPLFKVAVKNLILDGEMMVYNKEHLVYHTKGEHFDVKAIQPNDSTRRPCSVTYDILYFNDQSLINKPYAERSRLLASIFNEKPGVLTMCKPIKIRDSDHIIECRNKAFDQKEEGVVIKESDSVYAPGKRISSWIKIKPDYIDGLLSDFDLLVIGGYYNPSNKFIYKYLLGVQKKLSSSKSEFVAVCNISSGLSTSKRIEINEKLKQYWKNCAHTKAGRSTVVNNPPGMDFGSQTPDVWIQPEHSIISEVRASELVSSTSYGTPYTLRFPRIESLRTDKTWYDCCQLEEYESVCLSNSKVEKAVKRHITDTDINVMPPKRTRQSTNDKKTKFSVPSNVGNINLLYDNVPKVDRICEGKEFCVLNTANNLPPLEELHQMILRHGGKVHTFVAIAATESLRVSKLKEAKMCNIATVNWLMKAVGANVPLKKLIRFHPSDMLSYTDETEDEFKRKYDKYSDSFTKKVSVGQLKSVLDSMDEKDLDVLDRNTIYQLEVELEVDQSKPANMFRLATGLFWNPGKCNKRMDLAEEFSKFRGGKVKDSIDNLSHIFVDPDGFDVDQLLTEHSASRKAIEKIRFVNFEWVIQCFNLGDTVFVQGAAATPTKLVTALAEHGKAANLSDVTVCSMHTEGLAEYTDPSLEKTFRSHSFFMGGNVRKAVNEERADSVPIFLHEIPKLFHQKIYRPDVALISVSPPDNHGYCSLGTSVDCVRAALQHSKVIVAQINKQMPRTFGDAIIHQSHFDFAAHIDVPLPSHGGRGQTEQETKIGQLIAENLVDDGATLQMGIGNIPDAVLTALKNHKDLGIHSEMFADGVVDLVKSGCVTNAKKVIHKGRIVGSFLIGTKKLYDFVDNNPFIEMLDIAYVNNVGIVAKNPKMTAINSAIEVDLTGQVCSDSIGTRMYSGFGGQVDFIRGAAEGFDGKGKPIIALPAVTKRNESKIVPTVKLGGGIVTSRAHVHYVVTEYGIAYLFGKTLRQRAHALINIAHPDHRESLEKAAFERLKCMPSA